MWNLSPYLLWEERTEVREQLSFLIEKYSQKYKKTPFGQTALSPPWYRMRFSPILFCLVLKTLTEVTVLREVGWIRDLICHLGTGGRFWYSFSVFKKRPKDGTWHPVVVFPSHLALSYAQKEYQHLLCQHHHCLKPEGSSIWQGKGNQKGMLSCWN